MIYLDNAATTKMYDSVREILATDFGNPSAMHKNGLSARQKLKEARKVIADSINACENEIIFTSGGSEANNMTIKSPFDQRYGHMITTKIEHKSVLNTAKWLDSHGVFVSYVSVDDDGIVNPEDIEKEIRPDTKLISVMMVNNEIGSIQPIKEIAEIAKKHGVLFHVDAVQAYGKLPIDVMELGVDFLTASAHKIHGPKGVGFAYVRNGIHINPLIHGGQQENGRRAGTENISAIAAFAEAVKCNKYNDDDMKYLAKEFANLILTNIPDTSLNGPAWSKRIGNNVNICFKGIPSEELLAMLDVNNILASAGSACTSESNEPSHVLKEIGLSDNDANCSVRFSLGDNTMKELIDTARYLKRVCEMLR